MLLKLRPVLRPICIGELMPARLVLTPCVKLDPKITILCRKGFSIGVIVAPSSTPTRSDVSSL